VGVLSSVVSILGCAQETKPAQEASSAAAAPAKPAAPAAAKATPAKEAAAPAAPAAPARPAPGAMHPSMRPDAEAMFKQADTDQNGSLSLDEFKTIQGRMRERPPMPNMRQNIASFVQRADTDKDQKVSMEEFKVAMPKDAEKRFALMDKNKDGVITLDDAPEGPAAEMGNPMGMPPRSPMQGMLEKADANKDGKLSLEEITAAKPGFPKEVFEKMDANKDGLIESGEFGGLHPPKPEDKVKP